MTRLALLITGLWIGLLLASWIFASITFRKAAETASANARTEVREKLSSVPEPDRLMVLRHLASEVNRTMFGYWWVLQLVLGIALVGLAFRANGPWGWAAAALAVVLVQAAFHRPILELGRSIDFVPRPLPADIGTKFGRLHGAYVLLDFAKMLLLAVTAFRLTR
jgi:hypothetical protein